MWKWPVHMIINCNWLRCKLMMPKTEAVHWIYALFMFLRKQREMIWSPLSRRWFHSCLEQTSFLLPWLFSRHTDHPHPLFVKFLYIQDKAKILCLARTKQCLLYNGARVHILLLKKRCEFDSVKKKLRDVNLKYALLSMLKVYLDNGPKLFRSPQEVESFLRDFSPSSPWWNIPGDY